MSWPTLQKMLNGSQQKGMSSSSMVPKIKKAYTHNVDGIELQDEESKIKIKTESSTLFQYY